MGKLPPISAYDLAIICEHLEHMLTVSRDHYLKLKATPLARRFPKHDRTVEYWKDIHAGYAWALAVAKQRKQREPNGGRSTVQ